MFVVIGGGGDASSHDGSAGVDVNTHRAPALISLSYAMCTSEGGAESVLASSSKAAGTDSNSSSEQNIG